MKEKTRTVTRLLFHTALLLGAAAVVWISAAFVDTNVLALSVTLVIGGVYGIGVIELLQFRLATSTLSRALAPLQEKVPALDEWLDTLHSSLRISVRLRIEGSRGGLPSPILTPYLVGLLVMLGLLGTFVGMVVTLKGAVSALEGATEIQAIRMGLAAPIRGLGLAFGTSVAGVATSAMLGLMSTLSRRDRILATRHLDTKMATVFPHFSLAYDQRETFRALQLQTRAIPEVAEKLTTVADKLDRLGDRLIANQELFHTSAKTIYAELAAAVNKTHQENLIESVRLAGDHIKPLLQDAMTAITAETQHVHGLLTLSTKENLEELSRLFVVTSEEVTKSWKAGVEAHALSNGALIERMGTSLEAFKEQFEHMAESMLTSLNQKTLSQQQEIADSLKATIHELTGNTLANTTRMHHEVTGLLKSSEDLIRTRMETEATWIASHSERVDTITTAMRNELGALRDDEDRRGQAAVERLATLESTLASHLTRIGKELEDPMKRLIQTASEVPRAAAEVIGQLRQEASKSVERDNRLLEEHRGILSELDTLSHSLASTSNQQHEAIEQLVDSSKRMLEEVARRFTEHMGSEASNFSKIAESFAVSAVEMASLGDTFGAAVTVFNTSNGNLIENLARIEESLDKATSRSDEQLGYYVAQARGIIDHCMLSQKEIFEELRQLRQKSNVTLEAGEWKN